MAKQVRYLKQIVLHLEKEYGSKKAKVIMEKAEKRYNELIEENKNEPKEYYMHTRERIYPSVAVFDALLDEGIERKDAEDFVTDYYRWRSSGMAGKIRTIFKIPGLYKITPKFFFSMTKKMFGPQAGFIAENQYLGKDEMHFDMVKCPYYDGTGKSTVPKDTKKNSLYCADNSFTAYHFPHVPFPSCPISLTSNFSLGPFLKWELSSCV